MQKANTEDQRELAKRAAQGVAPARAQVNELVQPIIDFQTSRFCKRFCRENRFRYQCTLPVPFGSAPKGASLCEWGNASYGWMLDDLTSSKRLTKYQAREGSSLYNYLYQIANSLPFYERWKDWRFGRKVYVPTYIQELGPVAAKVFLALRSNQNIELIAQALGENTLDIENICQQVITLLTQKKRLHLLNPPENISLTQNTSNSDEQNASRQMEIASYDEPIEQTENKKQLKDAWQQLSGVEQYVVEALVIEDQDATDVLQALKMMGVSIKKGVTPEQTNRQQLYYFRRKTLAKLAEVIKRAEMGTKND